MPDVREVGLHSSPHDSSLFERSPLSGRSNPLAAPLVLEFVGEQTFGRATYGDAYEGPPGLVHGGYVISAFDDLLGVAQAASGIAGLTGTLTVKLLRRHAPAPGDLLRSRRFCGQWPQGHSLGHGQPGRRRTG